MRKLSIVDRYRSTQVLDPVAPDMQTSPVESSLSAPRPAPAMPQRVSRRLRPHQFLSLILLSGTFLIIGGLGFQSYQSIRSIILDGLKEKAQLQIEKANSELDEWLVARLSELQAIANTPQVRSMDWSILESYLQLEKDRLPDYFLFSLVFPDGSFHTTLLGPQKGESNKSDREHFQRTMAGEAYVSDPLISRSAGVANTVIAVPIWSFPPLNRNVFSADQVEARSQNLAFLNYPATDPLTEPEVIGELGGLVQVDRVAEVIETIVAGEGSYAFVIDAEGIPITHPDPALLEEYAAKKSLRELLIWP